MVDSSDRYVLLNQLADEFTERSRRGERPTLDEYCAEHPALADDIRELFPAMVELEDAHDAAESNDPPPVAEVLGDFRLIREIGRGGMGAVYEAEQLSLGRRVALKLLTQRLLRDARQLRRFEREARSTAKLHHTNIVPVHGFGEHDGIPYFVMQFIHGQPLDAVIREIAALEGNPSQAAGGQASAVARSLYTGSPLPSTAEGEGLKSGSSSDRPALAAPSAGAEAVSDPSGFSSSVVIRGRDRARRPRRLNYWQGVARIGSQAAQALEYAHGQGVVHRDVKPSNLLLDAASTVWVTDFGLAKADAADNLTTTGDVIGTLRYMAPEALDGRTDARSDVFSLGLTLYEMLALRPAYDQRDRNALIKQVAEASPPKLRALRPDVPPDLETIVHKAVEREPDRRYQTAGEFADDLQRFINDEPIRARRQTSVEAFWRWTRQNKAIATLLSAVTTLTIALSAGAVVTAAFYHRQETKQRQLTKAKTDFAERNLELAAENDAARRDAQAARERAERAVWEMQTSRGLLAAEADDPARAALWFASAAKQAAGDPARQAGSLLRARNWLRETHLPLRCFPCKETPRQFEFRAGGDLLLLVADGCLQVRDWRGERDLAWASELVGVGDARFSPDGQTVAVAFDAGGGGRFELRDAADGTVRRRVEGLAAARAVAFSPEGRLVAFADDTVRVMEVSSGRVVPAKWKHPGAVRSMVFDPRGELLASACADGRARVYAVADASKPAPVVAPIPHRPNRGSPPAFVKGGPGRRLATVGPKGEVLVTDVEGKEPPFTRPGGSNPRGHNPKIVAPPDGRWVAMTGEFTTVVQPMDRDAPTSRIEHAIWNEDLVCTPDGEHLLTASWDHTVRVWSAADGKQVGSPLPHMEIVRSLSLAPDGRHLATFGHGMVRVWRLAEANAARVADEPWYWAVRPSFDGKLIVPAFTHEFGWYPPAGVRQPGPLVARDAETGRDAGPAVNLRGRLLDCCVTADHRTMASAALDGGKGWLEFHDAYSGRRTAPACRLPALPLAVGARPNRNELALLCNDGRLHVVDATNGRGRFAVQLPQWTPAPRERFFADVRYTGDGAGIVVLDPTAQWIEVRDAETGALRFPRLRPILSEGPIRTFAVSSDGRLIATAVNGVNAAQVWDARTGVALSRPLLHQGDTFGLWHAAFTPDGERLLTACIDRQALLWDWRHGVLAAPPMKHADQVYRVEPTPDGRFAVTVSREMPCRVRLWDLATGRQAAPAQQVGGRLLRPPGASLTMTPDGGRVFVGPFSGLTRLDFSEFTEPPSWSADESLLLAELAAGQRIEDGHERTLTFDEWRDRLERVTRLQPELVYPAALDAADQHRRDANRLRDAGRASEAIAHARAAVAEYERLSSPDPFLLGRARWELAKLSTELGRPPPPAEAAATRALLEAAAAVRPGDPERVTLLADALLPATAATCWTVLSPRMARARNGTQLTAKSDGSLLATGPVSAEEVYTVTAPLPKAGVTAVALEALPDPSLPNRGPGRFENGNFVLSELQASISGADRAAPLNFQDADFLTRRVASAGFGTAGPALAIDGVAHTGWDVFPQVGTTHAAAFLAAAPIWEPHAELTVVLRQGVRLHPTHALGRFRLSVTTDSHPLREARLRAAFEKGRPLCRLGIARMLRGEWAEAVAPLERAAKVGTLLSGALLDLALQQCGRQAEADGAFELTWRAWDDVDPSFEEAGVVLEALAPRLAADPNRPALLARRLKCRAILTFGRQGADDLKRLLSREPNFAFTRADASCLVALGDHAGERSAWEAAILAFDLALKLDPESAEAAEGAALARLGKGDLAGYRRCCGESFQRFGGNSDALPTAIIGVCLVGDALPDRRLLLEAARRIASAEPNRPNATALAEALCRAGDHAAALAAWDEAWRRWPGAYPRGSAFRALACARLGRPDEARKLVEKAESDRGTPPMHDDLVSWRARVARDSLIREAKSVLR